MNLPRWVFLIAWGIWLVWFVVWETLAFIDKGENETLSGVLKMLMWKADGGPTVVAFIVAPLLLWLGHHFYSEVRTHWTT